MGGNARISATDGVLRRHSVSAEEETERQELETEDLAQQLAAIEREVRAGRRRLTRETSVVDALSQLSELARCAEAADPKLDQLVQEIGAIRSAESAASYTRKLTGR